MSRLRALRTLRNWTQAELARRSGVSRSSIAAIENGALVPSVHAALALARCLESTVEELFGEMREDSIAWAWHAAPAPAAYWEAAVDDKVLAFPVEPLAYSLPPPDGRLDGRFRQRFPGGDPHRTLVIASCDPAGGFLAAALGAKSGIRVLPFHRSSMEALGLLKQGVVHVAGTHLREVDEPGGNAAVVRELLGKGFRLLRAAVWQEGVAVRPGEGLTTLRKARSAKVRWIGRQAGTGARRCQDKVLARSPAGMTVAHGHWEVATAVRHGWVDAGVCHRLAAAHAGLDFIPVSCEAFDLCYPAHLEKDPRIVALRQIFCTASYRKCLGGFAGIDPRTTGEEETV